jgi:hypothetical protein
VKRFAGRVALVVGFLVWTPFALAQEPSSGLGEGGGVQGSIGGGGGVSAGGTLPFTGLDVLVLFVGGLALLAVGLGLRHVSRART